MKNKWMKSKVMNNFGLKVISLVVAFIVWLVIINTTNPTITKTFTDIPVKVINENVITSLNQVYEVVDGDMVDVVVKGKRSFVEELTNDDFSATADLSKLSTVNTAGIQVKLNKATKENVDLTGIMRCCVFHWKKRRASRFVSRSIRKANWQNLMFSEILRHSLIS